MSLILGKLAMSAGVRTSTLWTQLPSLAGSPPASSWGDVAADGKMYFVGGAVAGANSANIWRFDPALGTLAVANTDTVTARGVAVAAIGNVIYFGGGLQGTIGSETLNTRWRKWDVTSGAVPPTALTAHPTGNSQALVAFGGNIYALDLAGNTTTKAFWRYNVAANTWTGLFPLTYGAGAFMFGGQGSLSQDGTAIYAMVSNQSNDVGRLFRYDLGSNIWSLPIVPPGPATAPSITTNWSSTVVGGKILAVTAPPASVATATYMFSYDIASATWDTAVGRPANSGIEDVSTSVRAELGTFRPIDTSQYYVLGTRTGGPSNVNEIPFRRDPATSGGGLN